MARTMKRSLPLALAVVLAGCQQRSATTAKYFGGQPVEHWLQVIKSPDAKARRKAADMLGNVGPAHPGAVPALIEALRDADPAVRDAAVLALSRIGPPAAAAAPALEQAQRDSDPTVRAHASTALERVRGSG